MRDHKKTFEFLTGWDAGVAAQNAKIQELIKHYESILPLCSDRVRMQMNIDDLKQLIKPDGE